MKRNKYVGIIHGGNLYGWTGPNPDRDPQSKTEAWTLAKHLESTTGKKSYPVIIEEILEEDLNHVM